MATTDELARHTFRLMAAEWVAQMGARMRTRRLALGLKQREVAARLPGDVDYQQISKWERGIHKPNDDTLEHIAAALETTVPELMMDAPKPGTPDLVGALETGDQSELVTTLKLLVERQEALEAAVAEMAQELARIRRQEPPERRRAS